MSKQTRKNNLKCPHCPRVFQSQAGFTRHVEDSQVHNLQHNLVSSTSAILEPLPKILHGQPPELVSLPETYLFESDRDSESNHDFENDFNDSENVEIFSDAGSHDDNNSDYLQVSELSENDSSMDDEETQADETQVDEMQVDETQVDETQYDDIQVGETQVDETQIGQDSS